MAKKYLNTKDYLIIEMSWREYVGCTGRWSLCDGCGDAISEEAGYYVALTNEWLCENCMKAFINSAPRRNHKALETERTNWNEMVSKLRDMEVWDE